jgi:hypothetical protein
MHRDTHTEREREREREHRPASGRLEAGIKVLMGLKKGGMIWKAAIKSFSCCHT